MTVYNPGPYFVEISYQVAGGGPHVMTRPTNSWAGIPNETIGTFLCWDGSDIAADVMVEALVTKMRPLFDVDTTFSSWILKYQPDPEEPAFIVASDIMSGMTGTAESTSQFLTFEKTFTFRTEDNHLAKLVLLDVPTGGTISKTSVVTGAELALVNEFKSPANAWAGRDGSRPAIFRSLSNGVNDALKRAYRL